MLNVPMKNLLSGQNNNSHIISECIEIMICSDFVCKNKYDIIQAMSQKKSDRIDKYLADCGIGTRSEVKALIKKKRVSVDRVIINDPGFKVTDGSEVLVDNQPVIYEQYQYFMLNKPAGVISATEDNNSSTVLDLLKGENTKDLFPVGRLDKDTEGLLIITNDGKLAHELLSPKKHVSKVYYVLADVELSEESIRQFEDGIDIGDDKLCKPAKIWKANDGYMLEITEGRFHQVKRMFKACGSNVTYLKRISMGPVSLDESLNKGEYRKLTEEEIDSLKSCNKA